MPELPEVETVRRGLAPVLTGMTLNSAELRRADLRFPFPERFAARLAGQRVVAVARRAKYLLFALSGGETLIVHLGMSGRLTLVPGGSIGQAMTFGDYVYDTGALPQHDHVVMTLETGGRLVYNDPRRFGFMLLARSDQIEAHPLFANLGVEPLSDGLTAEVLAARARGRRTDLKAFLLDQRMVAGLGNIYVCEALFRAGLSPRRCAGTLARANGGPTLRARRLVVEIKAVLLDAIAAGGSSLRDYRHADGESGRFQEKFDVYGREGQPCLRPGCLGSVERLVQGQRSTFACLTCQR